MAKTKTLASLFILVLCISACELGLADDTQKTWCVAKPSSSVDVLLLNSNYACSQVDCSSLPPGCSSPDSLINRVSVIMNLYYATKGRKNFNCYFSNTGLVVTNDPSYEGCTYA